MKSYFMNGLFLLVTAGLVSGPLYAQQHDHATGIDHNMSSADSEDTNPKTMDMGSGMKTGMQTMDHSGMNMSSMQGGKPPTDARDPHAYSGGYTLDSGPYALSKDKRIRLADEHNFWAINFDRLEYIDNDGGVSAFDAQAWYGQTYDKLVVKTEGEFVDGNVEEIQTDLLWGHAISGFWDAQMGVRVDGGDGPNRNWLAIGLQGLAPYWFEMDSTAYVGESGRTALQFEAEYDLLLSQRLIVQPRVEFNLYGKDDPALGIGSGLSSAAAGIRLRYEFSRQFAPYVGMEWQGQFGDTADMQRAQGGDVRDTRWLAGLRLWF